MINYLRQSTAVTLVLGQFLYYLDAKTLLYLALSNDASNFDETKLTCYLTKGSVQTILTLTKTGGSNNMNLLPDSQATFELTVGNTDTCGPLKITFVNTTPGDEVILEGKVFEFFVVPSKVYDILVGNSNFLDDVALQATLLLVKEQTDKMEFDSSGAIRDQEPAQMLIEREPSTELNPATGAPAITQSTTVILGG